MTSLESFFSGGGKSISWKDKPLGTTVSGTITAVHPPAQQVDPADNKPKFKKNGEPQMYVRIDLQTAERDPQDPEDDGHRSLYVQGFMSGAVGDALRKAGRMSGGPEVGGQLTVQLIERTPNENPALNAINKFVAAYVSPSSQATGQFFNGQPQSAPVMSTASGQPQAYQQPVPAYPQQAVMQPPPQQPQYAQQPVPVQVPQPAPQPGFQGAFPPVGGYAQPPAGVPPQPQYAVPPQPVLPPRPDAISPPAWDAMDDATKIQLAKAMADAPPF